MDAEGPVRMDGIQDLGARIVEAARVAVAMHLYESVAQSTTPANGQVGLGAARQILRRRVETGGAGPCLADDSRLGDLVTDDERDGLMGRDGGKRTDDASAGR
jgi:hypothetical protein